MIIDGKQLAKEIEAELFEKFKTLPPKRVVFVMFGENAASRQFMGIKSRTAERLGIQSSIQVFPETITTDEAISIIKNLGTDMDGVVVQLPLPKHLDAEQILNSVPTEKDIDVLGLSAIEQYISGQSNRIAPVAGAVQEILNSINIDLNNKKIVIVGNGNLVGKPVAQMFSREHISHTTIDKDTDLAERSLYLSTADIIISGIGVPHFISPNMIKPGVVLIDAGTSEQSGKLVGDIDPACAEIASYMTPVPCGVGPVTIVTLFRNLLN
jgi:methylenetetrahydrofolate dehydrogenase (NADP+)/methenyltetrahydrofolate cyclohydrolase